MSLKLLVYALERASLEYVATGSPYALARALELIDTMHTSLNDVEELLFDGEQPTRAEEA